MTEVPDQVMLDTNAHALLKEHENLLKSVVEADIELYLSAYQANEVEDGLEDCSEEKRKEIEAKIQRVDDLAGPIMTTKVEPPKFDLTFPINFGASTGEIYDDLVEPHPNIGKVERLDAIGAEAAINRDMPFVTNDGPLQDKMREHDYDEYLLTLDDFREMLEED